MRPMLPASVAPVIRKSRAGSPRLTSKLSSGIVRPPPRAFTKASLRVQISKNDRLRRSGGWLSNASHSAGEKNRSEMDA